MTKLGTITILLCLAGTTLLASDIVDVADENGVVVVEGSSGSSGALQLDGGLLGGQSLKVENFLDMLPHEPSGPLDIEY